MASSGENFEHSQCFSKVTKNLAEVLVEVISEFPVGMLAVSATGSQSFNHSFNQVKNLTPLLAVGILVPL